MPTRYDIDPAQADAQMSSAQEQMRSADDALDDARQLVEGLENAIDNAHESEDDVTVAALEERHQQAERDLEAAQQEYDYASENLVHVSEFWFEDDIDPEDF